MCDLRIMLIRLKEFREKEGVSLEAMAERTGFSVSQLSRWESGGNNIPSQRLPILAGAYNCRIGEIFDEFEGMPSAEELERMIQRAMSELPLGVSYADYPHAVASNLHAQLKRFSVAGGFDPDGTDAQ